MGNWLGGWVSFLRFSTTEVTLRNFLSRQCALRDLKARLNLKGHPAPAQETSFEHVVLQPTPEPCLQAYHHGWAEDRRTLNRFPCDLLICSPLKGGHRGHDKADWIDTVLVCSCDITYFRPRVSFWSVLTHDSHLWKKRRKTSQDNTGHCFLRIIQFGYHPGSRGQESEAAISISKAVIVEDRNHQL